jgi:hypothetical protein
VFMLCHVSEPAAYWSVCGNTQITLTSTNGFVIVYFIIQSIFFNSKLKKDHKRIEISKNSNSESYLVSI